MTEEGYLMTDETSHNLQDRIDVVMDLINKVLDNTVVTKNLIRGDSPYYHLNEGGEEGRKLDFLTKDEKKLLCAVDDLEEIRDDIPCSCGEESK